MTKRQKEYLNNNCFAFPCSILMAVIMIAGCAEKIHKKETFFRMDTVVEVTVVARRDEVLQSTWNAIDSVLVEWEERFSQTNAHSEIRALNLRRTDTGFVSKTMARILQRARAYGDTCRGMFDFTIYPVKQLWGFEEGEIRPHIPSEEELENVLEKVDYSSVYVDTSCAAVIFSDVGTTIDIGGVAKGFVLDIVDSILNRRGYRDYLIVAGGDIVVRGRRRDKGRWKIGIQHPRNRRQLLASFSIDSGAVVTSGDYERYFTKDSVRYHHLFSPSTASCCRKNQSLTITCDSPVEADILSTGLFCLDYDKILKFIESRSRLECVIVDSSGKTHVSAGWSSEIENIE